MIKEVQFEESQAELEDDYSDDSLFNISSWGADLSFRELISMYDEEELVKPELQRKYVWSKIEASRFIESLLMGLPVPSIFLAKSGSRQLIVDGYQRIMTVYDFVSRGVFSGDNTKFRLSNTEKINKRWRNKTFLELSQDEQRKLRSTTIHAIVFEQKHPENDDTSMYQIFERINASGKTLTPQEIRNCVYQGKFNELLFELNDFEPWRELYGSKSVDNRMRDIECILRFFVMKSPLVQDSPNTRISLKQVFNQFMGSQSNLTDDTVNVYKSEFKETMTKIFDTLGANAFRNYSKTQYTNKFNPSLFDAISVAYYEMIHEHHTFGKDVRDYHKLLFDDSEFLKASREQTTNITNIKARINIAKQILGQGGEHEGCVATST